MFDFAQPGDHVLPHPLFRSNHYPAAAHRIEDLFHSSVRAHAEAVLRKVEPVHGPKIIGRG